PARAAHAPARQSLSFPPCGDDSTVYGSQGPKASVQTPQPAAAQSRRAKTQACAGERLLPPRKVAPAAHWDSQMHGGGSQLPPMASVVLPVSASVSGMSTEVQASAASMVNARRIGRMRVIIEVPFLSAPG